MRPHVCMYKFASLNLLVKDASAPRLAEIYEYFSPGLQVCKKRAAAYVTGQFPGEGEERRKASDKICRGKYLAGSSQSFIKVNWPVERTRSASPSITCPIVSQSLPP